MLFSLVISGAAGWYLWTSLQEKSIVEAPLSQVTPAAPTPVPVAAEATPLPGFPITKSVPVPGQPQSNAAVPSTTEPSSASVPAGSKRRILFKLKSSARKVAIVGSFNNWFRQAMTKKDGVWSVTLELEPGTYEYKFVVDQKRIKDPNNKTVKNGNSVLTVKPTAG